MVTARSPAEERTQKGGIELFNFSKEVAFVIVGVLFLSGCPVAAPVINPLSQGVSVHADPTGDAGPAPTFDIIEVMSTRSATNLAVRYWTTPAGPLPAPGAAPVAGQISFLIVFNTDLNRATGIGIGGVCGGGQGLEFFVDGGLVSGRNADGTYNVRDAGLAITGTAAVSVDGPRTTLTVPLVALGGDDGRTEAYVLTDNSPITVGVDCAPDAGQGLPTRRGERTILGN